MHYKNHNPLVPEKRSTHRNTRDRDKDAIWSGKVTASMARAIKQLQLPTEISGHPARSLDLGCGEGGDVCWLAERGYSALGIDVSSVAVERASARARSEGIVNAEFRVAHAETWLREHAESGNRYDLITANFFQPQEKLNRNTVLRCAFDLLAPDGVLLTVSRASMPSWFSSDSTFAAPGTQSEPTTRESELRIFERVQHRTRLAEVWERIAKGANGEVDMIEDFVVAVQR